MNRTSRKQRFIAIVLSVIIIASGMPVLVAAETWDEAIMTDTVLNSGAEAIEKIGESSDESEGDTEIQEIGGKTITAFAELEESVAQQSVVLGAPLSELNLPEALSTIVDGEIVSVPVTWACTPEYQNEAREYIFTAVFGEGYTLAEGIKTPSITAVFQETAPLLSGRMELAGEETNGTVVLSQDQTVADIASAIQTALSDADSNTVVVTGSKTNATSSLSFNIPEGKTVVWGAVLKGGTADYLICLNGKGTFEVAEGGEINASSGGAIMGVSSYPAPDIPSITVSGGIVSNMGTEDYPAIYLSVETYGDGKVEVTVKNGGKVKSTGSNGIAIKSTGNIRIQDAAEVSADGTALIGKSITVDGGTISANKTAVYAEQGLLVSGGVISANDFAVFASGRRYTTNIQSGRVEATGSNGYAVYAAGNVQVSGGTVSAAGDNGAAICSISSGSVVVEGGTVSASKTGISLSMGSVVVRGGIVKGGNNAIYAMGGGAVMVEGGKVEAADVGGSAIYAMRDVFIKGGTVSANEDNGTAIKAMGSRSYVTIENGTVEAMGSGGKSVFAQQSERMLVKGGTVKAHSTAIYFSSDMNSTLAVSGGTISADNTAIYFAGHRYSTIAVDGGTISGGDVAIHFEGFINPVITVSGGTISGGTISGGGNAIRLIAYMNPSVTVTGGMVLGCGSKYVTGHDSAAIYMESGDPTVTSPGTVIQWNKSAGNRLYGLHTASDLASLPESAVKWSRIDDKSGISYGSDGFLDMDDVSVAEITAGATGLDELKIGKAVDAVITYTLTGGSYAIGLEALDLAPEGLPDWLSITDTVIESTTLGIFLSGTPTGISGPLTLALPDGISAANLTGGSVDIPIPINGMVTIGTVAKGDGAAIADCTTTEITATDVTLESITGLPNGQGAEYAVSETAFPPPSAVWQDSVSFSGLSPNTEYYAFVRSKENEYYSTGAPSSGIRFNTAKAQLSGSVSVGGSPAYGATMTAVVEELYSTTLGVSPEQLGSLSYQWWRRSPDGVIAAKIPSATSSGYTIVEGDIGQIIWVEIMAANCEGTASGGINKPVDKAMPMGTPAYIEVTKSGKTLADAELKGSFLNLHNNTPVPGIISWDVPLNTLVQRGKTYRWSFIATEEGCFHTAYGSIILWSAAIESEGTGDHTSPAAVEIELGKTPDWPVTVAALITATAGQSGAASASIPDKTMTDAIAKAQAEAKKQNKTASGISVELAVTMPMGTTSLTATLTRSSLDKLISAGVTCLDISGAPVKVTFDLKALQEIQKQSSSNISITIAPKANLSAAAKKIIGTRPVYDITVGYGSGKTVSGFGGGAATVFIPYTLGKNEAVGGLYAVYVDAKGNATRIAGSVYDTNSRSVIFSTNHLSVYGIGYTAPSAKFTDITNHWAKESIDYVVGRGVLYGTSDTAFSPDITMTRGMLVTALGRLTGVDAKSYTKNFFTDVKADSSFRPYIEWAYSKGIVQGIEYNQFAPDRAITREELALIFANYAKTTGYKLPVTRTATTYADASSIGSSYSIAVTAMQQAGIMVGGTVNKFNPKGNSTRAEISSMLHRYIKLTIDPATAQGWTLNDAGQYLYYKDDKVLTGTQTLDGVKYSFETTGVLKTGWVRDGGNWYFYSGITRLTGKWLQIGGKWYYFNADGSLARSTKIDGYEVDKNGVRKSK